MPESISITLNGENHVLDANTTVDALISSLGMRAARVAVEINRNIVDREKFSSIRIAAGDDVEIVNFVGGG